MMYGASPISALLLLQVRELEVPGTAREAEHASHSYHRKHSNNYDLTDTTIIYRHELHRRVAATPVAWLLLPKESEDVHRRRPAPIMAAAVGDLHSETFRFMLIS